MTALAHPFPAAPVAGCSPTPHGDGSSVSQGAAGAFVLPCSVDFHERVKLTSPLWLVRWRDCPEWAATLMDCPMCGSTLMIPTERIGEILAAWEAA